MLKSRLDVAGVGFCLARYVDPGIVWPGGRATGGNGIENESRQGDNRWTLTRNEKRRHRAAVSQFECPM